MRVDLQPLATRFPPYHAGFGAAYTTMTTTIHRLLLLTACCLVSASGEVRAGETAGGGLQDVLRDGFGAVGEANGINDALGSPRQGGALVDGKAGVGYWVRLGPADDDKAVRLDGEIGQGEMVLQMEAGQRAPKVSPKHDFVGMGHQTISWEATPGPGGGIYVVVGARERTLDHAPLEGISILALPGSVQTFVRGRKSAEVPLPGGKPGTMRHFELEIRTPDAFDGRGLARLELRVDGKPADLDAGSKGTGLVTQGFDRNLITLGGIATAEGPSSGKIRNFRVQSSLLGGGQPTEIARVEDFIGNEAIWHTAASTPLKELGPGRAAIRQSFELVKPTALRAAAVSLVSSTDVNLGINGKALARYGRLEASKLKGATAFMTYEIPVGDLVPGRNVLTYDASMPWRGSAGVQGNIYLEYTDGSAEVIPLGSGAKVTQKPAEGWKEPAFDDSSWPNGGVTRGGSSWGYWMGWLPPVDDARFPEFIVPGQEPLMEEMRRMYHTFYCAAFPNSTLWDQWMVDALVWPAMPGADAKEGMAGMERRLLLGREIDQDGLVGTQQHLGLGHSYGWPFPLWTQAGGIGWHFSLDGLPYGAEFGIFPTKTLDGFKLENAEMVSIGEPDGLTLKLEPGTSAIQTPSFSISKRSATFVRIDWLAPDFPAGAKVWLEWKQEGDEAFLPEKRLPVAIPSPDRQLHDAVMVELPKNIDLDAKLIQFRLVFELPQAATAQIKHIVSTTETRHNSSNPSYLIGFTDFVNWTGDIEFLRHGIEMAREAMSAFIRKYRIEEEKMVVTPDIGKDGRSGFYFNEAGEKIVIPGQGIGNNYFDILPFGGRDVTATYLAYTALLRMARLEEWIDAHPEVDLPKGGKLNPVDLRRLAGEVKKTAAPYFWNKETGRFPAAEDLVDKVKHDYGFVFVNNEAIYYDFAEPGQAKEIRSWIDGQRIVEGDTSQGPDIYRYRFGPRMTTKRNLTWYIFPWSAPETIPWGGQVQDGGSVLGFTYQDIMARLKVNGPDDAWARTREVLAWHQDVMAAGGFREYYSAGVNQEGSLQGEGIGSGGLGIVREFIESALFPQVMVAGFLGLDPQLDGMVIKPQLPRDWPALTITRIRFHGGIYSVKAEQDGAIEVTRTGGQSAEAKFFPRLGKWRHIRGGSGGSNEETVTISEGEGVLLPGPQETTIRLEPIPQ